MGLKVVLDMDWVVNDRGGDKYDRGGLEIWLVNACRQVIILKLRG